jgi:transcriptional regulator
MYIPPYNHFQNQQEAISFMQRYSFATLVTVKDGVPSATHIPVLIKRVDDKIVLRSHLAKANPQCDDLTNGITLIIFTEPHAYISPKHYEKEASVPTWNYLAVHAYGKCNIVDVEENKALLIEETINTYEAAYLAQWNAQSDTFKQGMLKGIVAFEIVVDDLQSKSKLSQNKTEKERDSIIDELGNSESSAEKETAEYMKNLIDKTQST